MDAWFGLALISSLAYCASLEVNSLYKIEANRLNAWRAFFGTILFLPVMSMMEWSADVKFYLAVLFTAVISVYGMNIQYRLAASHNSRVAGLVGPVSILTAFLCWFLIDYNQRSLLLSHPDKLLLVLSAIAVLFASVFVLRKNKMGWSSFRIIVPVGFLYGAYNVVAKLVLEGGGSAFQTTLTFVMLSNLLMALWYAPHLLRDAAIMRDAKADRSGIKPVLIAGLLVGFFHTASWLLMSLALVDAQNPAYPTIVGSISPVWYLIYYKLRGMKDEASPIAGASIVLASMMILLAQ